LFIRKRPTGLRVKRLRNALLMLGILFSACSLTPAPPDPIYEIVTNTPQPQLAPDTPIPMLPQATIAPDSAAPLPTEIVTPGPTLATVPGAIGPYTFADNVDPLTGETVADPAVLNRRPMVVKISNAPPIVRPQSGLNAADLVFEHYAEGGLTRFLGVFYSQAPERVGSIRSARLIDYELVPMYQALLAFSGASTGVEEYIYGSEFADRAYKGVLYGQPYYWRDESIDVPHNLFTSTAALWNLATEEGLNDRPNLSGMAFLQEPPPDSAGETNAIDIRYIATSVRWEYDAEQGIYRRFSDGEPHYDANSDTQVTADNVVIIFAEHRFTDIVESQFGDSMSYSIEIKLWFEGDAVLFRDGQRYEGRWVRPTRESMLSLRTRDGELMYLRPGNTWFQVVRPPDQQDPAEEGVTVS